MPPIHDDAVCIRHWDWSETSQTVSLFTRAHGVVRALAKGAKRPKAPYSGGVELLTLAEAGIILRPSSDLALLTSWDLRRTYSALRSNLNAYHSGMYMADLVHHFVRDHDPHAALFDALLAALERLAADPAMAVLRFQWSTLVEAGYKPQLAPTAALNGEGGRARGVFTFNPSLGTLSPGESQTDPREGGGDGWRVRSETIEVLNSLSSASEADLGHGKPASETVNRANRLLGAYIRHILGTEPPTLPLLFGPRLPR